MHTRSLWLMVAIIITAMAARLYHIQVQSIWFDEGWSAYAATQPTLQAAVEADPTNPPLYYVLLNLTTRAFGDSEFALRWFSTAFGLLVIALSFRLARQLFSERAGLYVAFLIAFSPLLWWASQEARMYTLMATLLLVAVLGWQRLLHKPARWAWLAVWGAELGLLYTHNTGPVVVFWLNVVTFVAWAWQRIRTGHGVSLQPDWRVWFAGQLGVGLLWLAWFISRFLLLQEANSAVSSPPQVGLELLSQMWQSLWAGSWLMVGREPLVGGLAIALFIVGLALIPWQLTAARWLMLHVATLTVGLLLGLWAIGNEMHGRYLVMVAPLLLVAIGAGLSRMEHTVVRNSLAGLFLVSFLVSVHEATQNPAYRHDDARSMVLYYADHLTDEDVVLAWSYADRYDLAYYWERLGVQARRVTLPEGADLETILPLLPDGDDVALNVWYMQRADYRGMMPCVLSHGTANQPEAFAVYGMSDQLYRSPALAMPELQTFEASLADNGLPIAELEAVGGFPSFTAEQAACLPLQIMLTQDIDADLKAAVMVDNDLGWEIARADAIFATANQRTSSQLAPGDTMTAYALLRLPYGAPAGEYRVRLRIYDEAAETSGYDFLNAGDGQVGKDLELGTWTVLPGADWSQANRGSDLPVTVNLPVDDNLTLVGHNIVQQAIVNGDILRLAFLWQGSDPLPDMSLAADDGSWQVPVPSQSSRDHDLVTLDWRQAQIPPGAGAGSAELRLGDGTPIARYTVEALPAQFTEPEYDVPIEVDFPGVGTLVGYTLESNSVSRNQPVPITLVWRGGETASAGYTVFVQLIAGDRVIAQSDSIPADGSRPTTGWRPGEYIVDQHQVVFHDEAVPGKATLIAGLYDAVTGERVRLATGEDAIKLAETITVR
jgi:uncharacterized membrane protein